MKRSKKITIGIITFFIVIAIVVIGRYSVGLYFKKKFSKRPPPGVIVKIVENKNFSQTLESYCQDLLHFYIVFLHLEKENRTNSFFLVAQQLPLLITYSAPLL